MLSLVLASLRRRISCSFCHISSISKSDKTKIRSKVLRRVKPLNRYFKRSTLRIHALIKSEVIFLSLTSSFSIIWRQNINGIVVSDERRDARPYAMLERSGSFKRVATENRFGDIGILNFCPAKSPRTMSRSGKIVLGSLINSFLACLRATFSMNSRKLRIRYTSKMFNSTRSDLRRE